MLKTDVQPFAAALNELADALDHKHITEGANRIWFDILREFPCEMVCGLLRSWPKSHAKFPVPAEVWKVLNDMAIADRERASEDLRKEAQQPVKFAKTEEGQRALKHIRKLMKNPKPTPLEHWRRVLENQPVGTLAHDFANQALAFLERRRA